MLFNVCYFLITCIGERGCARCPQRPEELGPLEVESQAVMSPLIRVLGPKLESCTREVHTPVVEYCF